LDLLTPCSIPKHVKRVKERRVKIAPGAMVEHPNTQPESGLLKPEESIDWTGCPEVERVPGNVSGVPILKGTRVQSDAIAGNHLCGCSPAEIADMYNLNIHQVRAVL
jgi:uncharacterized protein (DUF433 family)